MEQLDSPNVSYEKYKKGLRNCLLHLPNEFREVVIQVCKNDLTEEMIETIRRGYVYEPTQQVDLPTTQILTKIHGSKDLWHDLISLERAENMELFLKKWQSGEVFNPFFYISGETRGIRERPFTIGNESYLAKTDGGSPLFKKRWVHLYRFNDNRSSILLFCSLSEFDQENLWYDRTSMDGFKRVLWEKIIKDPSTRISLIFTKPDILLRKLQKGVQYNGELCYEIRPELENISSDNNLKLIVNSIVNEYSTYYATISKENFKYHIVNCLERNEVIETMTRIIQDENSQNSQDITCPFISTS